MRDLIVSVPDHCLSFYFGSTRVTNAAYQVSCSSVIWFQRITCFTIYGHSGHLGHVA